MLDSFLHILEFDYDLARFIRVIEVLQKIEAPIVIKNEVTDLRP